MGLQEKTGNLILLVKLTKLDKSNEKCKEVEEIL